MIIALPVCSKDEHLAIANLEWCLKMEGPVDFKAVIITDGFTSKPVEELAEKYFASISRHVYDQWRGEPEWPHPQNWAWQSAARHFAHQKDCWLWWEGDAVPIKKGWLYALQEAKEKCGKPFMGCLMSDLDGHMNGVGIYPPVVHHYSINGMLCRNKPFDVVMGRDIHKHAAHTPLIQHVISDKGTSFPGKNDLGILNYETVLFHRCKDGSLIKRLEETRNWKNYVPDIFRSKPKPLKVIPIIAHLDASSGYGIFSAQIALELQKLGYKVELYPPSWNEIHGTLPAKLKDCIRKYHNEHGWGLVIFPCVIQPSNLVLKDGADYAYFSMWESTRLISTVDPSRVNAVRVMNKCKVIITPNAWNASCFSSCGVNSPIRICPMGFDPVAFPEVENKLGDTLVFGTAAKTAGGGIRKGFDMVVEAFRLAFKKGEKVKLRVKAFQEDPKIETYGDDRIEVTQKYISQPELVDWYKSLNVFVSGSASEGWGRHQHEAMCMGRPVIGIDFGGVCEFFSWENGYAVDYSLVAGEGIYKTMGIYARPCLSSMSTQMRRAYENRKELKSKIELATKSARRFTLENCARTLIDRLREFNFDV